ncbi:CRISPR-associated endonuclease Cas1 [Entomospira culicis]|uniref:CRISPR-associated endonuclease Cas1 n=1 Tax=Entomospira culicis TaxID=2719989 RepID=A0A968GHI8_9SPIO|nr:CRISPR-associated endonuclease Cas1 [Entomospira culicis]NIZ18922.1 CRISPR-associated endonuclease Cas1 [Entomospira culicis]NIZ69137.1 CRISPR-associated endonuclease Cas1 [Entomospira culicis]WDI37723.1 CRISPR-associated endonuclease Cas1 [Entomospira culicis]WDI39351.1 CRISPR-associated endonuclease Cas1 [Entomospira culicis]
MKKMLNTLFIESPKSSLRMEGESIVLRLANGEKKKLPTLNIDSLVIRGSVYVSSRVLAYCAKHGILVSYFSVNDRMLFKIDRSLAGSNVLLRRAQHEATKAENALPVAKSIVMGKILNQHHELQRYKREYAKEDRRLIEDISKLKHQLRYVELAKDLDELRGYEGVTSSLYFKYFNDRIRKHKREFFMKGRNRRPPMDRVNALLSYGYQVLYHDMIGLVESVGLDPAMGFLHRDRPGRMSLALDMMEEFRSLVIDRLVIRLINLGQITPEDFDISASGSVRIKDKARRIFLEGYVDQKRESYFHFYTGEKLKLPHLWHVQGQLLARYLRGNIEGYPAFVVR